jgi:ribosome recycling factor
LIFFNGTSRVKILEGITIPLDTKVNLSALGQPSIKDYSTLLFTLSQPQHLQKVDKVLREKGWTTSVVNSHTLKLSLPRMDSKRKSEIQKEIKKEKISNYSSKLRLDFSIHLFTESLIFHLSL